MDFNILKDVWVMINWKYFYVFKKKKKNNCFRKKFLKNCNG